MNLARPDRSARLDALAAAYALGTLGARARRRLDRDRRRPTRRSRPRSATGNGGSRRSPRASPASRRRRASGRGFAHGWGFPAEDADRGAGANAPWWSSLVALARARARRVRAGVRARRSRCSRRPPSGRSRASSSCSPARTPSRRSSRPPSAAAAILTVKAVGDRSTCRATARSSCGCCPTAGAPRSLGLVPGVGHRPRPAARAGRRRAAEHPGARGQPRAGRRIADRRADGPGPLHGPRRADLLTPRSPTESEGPDASRPALDATGRSPGGAGTRESAGSALLLRRGRDVRHVDLRAAPCLLAETVDDDGRAVDRAPATSTAGMSPRAMSAALAPTRRIRALAAGRTDRPSVSAVMAIGGESKGRCGASRLRNGSS